MFPGFIFRALSAFALILPVMAQTPVPSAVNPIPHRLTLTEAETLLIQRNLAVVAARYQIESNRAARLIASYKPNPVLTIGLEQLPFYSPVSGSFPRFWKTNLDAGAQPTYTVRVDKIWERGGKRELRTAIADSQLKATEAQMLDALRTQLYQLRQAFAVATLAQENLLVAEATEQQYAQTEKLTQIKVENGDLAGVEVYRVSAGRLQYQQAVLQARTAYQQAARDVLNLLGAKAEEIAPSLIASTGELPSSDGHVRIEQIAQQPEPAQSPPALGSLQQAPLELIYTFDDRPVVSALAELRATALAERPDVIVARNTLAAATSAIRLAQSQRTRDFSLGYEYQRTGQDHTLGVVLQIPLFTYNNQQAGIAQSEAQKRAAEALLRQTEMQAITDVEKAYQAYLAARRVLELYNTQNLSQVEKLRSITAWSYKEGALSLFEVLDAQRTYNQTVTAYNQARADYQNALWQLEQAIGKPLR